MFYVACYSSSLYSEILVQAAGVDFFQVVAHTIQVGFVVFARFDGVDRFDTAPTSRARVSDVFGLTMSSTKIVRTSLARQ